MKKLLIALLLLPMLAFAKDIDMKEYDWKITRVIDGDTVAFEAKFLPEP